MSQFCCAHSQLFRNLAYLRKPTQFISLIYGESKRQFRIRWIPESGLFISMVFFSTFCQRKLLYLFLFLCITSPVVLTVFCSSCHQLMSWLVKFCTVRLNLLLFRVVFGGDSVWISKRWHINLGFISFRNQQFSFVKVRNSLALVKVRKSVE